MIRRLVSRLCSWAYLTVCSSVAGGACAPVRGGAGAPASGACSTASARTVERLRPLLGRLRATSVDQDDTEPIPDGTAADAGAGAACVSGARTQPSSSAVRDASAPARCG